MKSAFAPGSVLVLLTALPFVMLACGENLTDFRTNGEASDGNAADANASATDGNVSDANAASVGNTTTTPVTNPNASNSNGTTTTRKCTPPATPVTYTNTTKALINQHCQSCHASRTPVMNTYAKAQGAFVNAGAQDQVQSGGMPLNETLSDAIKCQFEAWGDNNYAN